MSDARPTLPMFPLGTVVFPGVQLPLHVFEDRYRALVHHLLRQPEPEQRLFGSVAIREGYEVGDHGTQSLYRVGCRLQLSECEANLDGSFDIVVVGRDRIRLDALETTGEFPAGRVSDLPDPDAAVPAAVVEGARAVFTAYRVAVAEFRGDPFAGALPRDPLYLSWTLAALAPLPMAERQGLLEAADAGERLVLVTDLLRAELRAMNAIPSLPATEVARTRWSPN